MLLFAYSFVMDTRILVKCTKQGQVDILIGSKYIIVRKIFLQDSFLDELLNIGCFF